MFLQSSEFITGPSRPGAGSKHVSFLTLGPLVGPTIHVFCWHEADHFRAAAIPSAAEGKAEVLARLGLLSELAAGKATYAHPAWFRASNRASRKSIGP